ncbi:hypothetical protein [Phyllobacterium lublinensis]|uniref:hypothetical protein n=1 Tax=Phyllobacterium lublinensis TaxID=2875708 RepID=UPI001CCC8056|nr:hypothetical protein [Phyllobacterium sp. 2063]MBZ9653512.1 hypothetical protein [Phyllobacterium sp. 2063]
MTRSQTPMEAMISALQEAHEYFAERADADHNGISYVANTEMRLQLEIEQALRKAGALTTSRTVPLPIVPGFVFDAEDRSGAAA